MTIAPAMLSQPAWLLLTPLAAMPVLLAWLARRRQARISPYSIAAQCVVLALLVLCLCQPTMPLRTARSQSCLLLTDRSGSVRGQDPLLQVHLPADRSALELGFSAHVGHLVGLVSDRPSLDDWQTNLAPVLETILGQKDQAGAAVIATDGRFTDSDWQGLARQVGQSGVQVLIVPMDHPAEDARINSLSARRQADGRVEVRATVSANAPLRCKLFLRRVGLDGPLLEQDIALPRDVPMTYVAADRLRPDESATYAADVHGDEVIRENNRAKVLLPASRQRLAAVGVDPALLAALPGPVDRFTASDLPTDATALANYSALILTDATGNSFTSTDGWALSDYVRQGGGLVMIGTGPANGPADAQDPLNRVLGLLANAYERRPLAVRVVLDVSGSMATPTTAPGRPETPKLDLAREAVLSLESQLSAKDSLAVIAFADEPKWVYDSRNSAPDWSAAANALRGLSAGGSTRVIPAIELALAQPAGPGREPLLLVLSDLQTEPFDAPAWADRIRQRQAHLAIVAIGKSQSSPPLEQLAALLGAPYQQRQDLTGLAGLFAQMVHQARGGIVQAQKTQLTLTGALAGVPAPPVDATIPSAKRDEAELLGQTAQGDAVAAMMPAGLGRAISLAVPLTDAWNASWRTDPQAAALVAAMVAQVAAPGEVGGFTGQVRRQGPVLIVTLQAVQDGRFVNDLSLTAEAWCEQTQRRPMEQVAPGQYRAELPCPAQFPAAVAVTRGGRVLWRGSSEQLYAEEFAATGADPRQLALLAELTGGRIVSAGDVGTALRQAAQLRSVPLWPWLLGAALALMLAEWVWGRMRIGG